MRRCRDTGQERMPVARGLSREAAGLQPRQSVTIPPLTRRSCPVIPRASSLTKSATIVSKVYVSFRGGWGAAMLPGYPAGVAATSPPYPTLRGAIPWATRPGTHDLRRSFWSAAQHDRDDQRGRGPSRCPPGTDRTRSGPASSIRPFLVSTQLEQDVEVLQGGDIAGGLVAGGDIAE